MNASNIYFVIPIIKSVFCQVQPSLSDHGGCVRLIVKVSMNKQYTMFHETWLYISNSTFNTIVMFELSSSHITTFPPETRQTTFPDYKFQNPKSLPILYLSSVWQFSSLLSKHYIPCRRCSGTTYRLKNHVLIRITMASSNLNLLQLPMELRLEIYSYSVANKHEVIVCQSPTLRARYRDRASGNNKSGYETLRNLQFTCK